jgi:Ribbon-helix-helix protein, copG family
VKTITITIPEELDRRAAAEARRRGISKSELIRQGLGAVLAPTLDQPDEDLWRSLAAFGGDHISVAPGEVDDIVYGR